MRRLVLLNLVLWLAVAAAAGAAGFFFWDQAQYIRTNQAQVGADLVVVSAPGAGRLTQWSAKAGDRVSAGTVLGTLQPLPAPMSGSGSGAGRDTGRTPGGPGQGGQVRAEGAAPTVSPMGRQRMLSGSRSPARSGAAAGRAPVAAQGASPPSPSPAPSPPPVNLTSPIDGTVLYTAAAAGTLAVPGRTLAVLADLSKPFVIAYIDGRTLKNLSVGKDVDVFLDAYPGTSFPGKVVGIVDAAGTFAAPELPSAAGTNQTRPTERVPVRIAVDDFSGKYVVPGMNASVRIHR